MGKLSWERDFGTCKEKVGCPKCNQESKSWSSIAMRLNHLCFRFDIGKEILGKKKGEKNVKKKDSVWRL